jgi:hypothetical protein
MWATPSRRRAGTTPDVACLQELKTSDESITRPIGAVLLEANDEWQLQNRYIQIEGMAELATPRLTNYLHPRLHRKPRDR